MNSLEAESSGELEVAAISAGIGDSSKGSGTDIRRNLQITRVHSEGDGVGNVLAVHCEDELCLLGKVETTAQTAGEAECIGSPQSECPGTRRVADHQGVGVAEWRDA